jgi:hypothetical protein
MFITYQTGNDQNLNGLQLFFEKRLHLEQLVCSNGCIGTKTIYSKISTMHLFIDILYLQSNYFIYIDNNCMCQQF